MRNTVTDHAGALSGRVSPRRTLLITWLVLASVAAVVFAMAPHANAQTPDPDTPAAVEPEVPGPPGAPPEAPPTAGSNCPNRFVVYDLRGFRGAFACYLVGSADMRRFGPRFNDKASSVWNRTRYQWCLYADPNYRGFRGIVQPGQRGNLIPQLDNKVSSLRRAPGPNRC
jgi:hypothetical protein